MTKEKFNEIYLTHGINMLTQIIKYRDKITFDHSVRVAGICREMGASLGLNFRELDLLSTSAFLHDIGNVGVADSILLKPAQLDQTEINLVRDHCLIGESVLLASEFEGNGEAADIIRHHHENFNGHGYPDGLSGEEIPFFSRIIGIADSYSAMAEPRKTPQGMPHLGIMEELEKESGEKHDPFLLNVFRKLISESIFRTRTAA